LPPVNNNGFAFVKIFIHAIGNHVHDILMVGNSGQIFRFVFCSNMHVCCKLECVLKQCNLTD
jgi:hypothetical protein